MPDFRSQLTLSLALLLGSLQVACGNLAIGDVERDTARPGTNAQQSPTDAARTRDAMVTTANPYATAAGAAMLEAGGTAVDAAIAAHLVLGLVEPQSSGIGGGGFMLVYDAAAGTVKVVDGRETAPAAARPDMFLDPQGNPLGYLDRVQSGHSVGVPGAIALYRLAHERYGKLPWPRLFEPAIQLAEQGFTVSARLSGQLAWIAAMTDLDEHADTAAYFFPGGKPLPIGFVRTNPEYAATLRAVAEGGPDAFYKGAVASAVVERVRQAPRPGTLTVEDIARYRAVLRDAVCAPYRSYRVCSVPPPSSGVALLETLGLVERFAPSGLANDPAGWGAFIDAMQLAYADRDHYVGDADFVDVPTAGLVDPRYWQVRAAARPAPGAAAGPGDPGAALDGVPMIDRWGRDVTAEVQGTTHLSVVDGDGNAVALTASVEGPFGSQRMAAGFVLNNELTDFSSVPAINGRPVANAVAPGKRPRSSMTPTVVFDSAGQLFMVTGSPGGGSIVAYTAKSIIGVIDFGLSAADAIALPNVVAKGLPVRMEKERAAPTLLNGLRSNGYPIDASQGENSGLHPIVARPGGLEGAADPRREGVATRITLPPAGR